MSIDYYQNLRPPKVKTREWLKVLTLDQILSDRTRFSVCQKIHQLHIMKKAILRKMKAIDRFEKYRPCNLGIVLKVTDLSVYERVFDYEDCVQLDHGSVKKIKEYRQQLEAERRRKRIEVRETTALETLGGKDHFSFRDLCSQNLAPVNEDVDE